MKKAKILMVATALIFWSGGVVKGQETKPGGNPIGPLTSDQGDGTDDTKPLPKKGSLSSGGDGGTQMRKAGGDPNSLTLHDQKQISGNLNGDGKTGVNGDGKTFIKHQGYDKTSSLKKNNGTKAAKGFIKGEKSHSKQNSLMKYRVTDGTSKAKSTGGGGAGKVSLSGNSALQGNNTKGFDVFHKNGGLNKPGMADGSALPAGQAAH